MFGDPHIATLDGFEYSFMGRGEFDLIKTSDGIFTMQGRLLQPQTAEGVEPKGTVIAAIAAKTRDSSRVHVEVDKITKGGLLALY